jgi:hypothetical protein
VRSQVGHVRLSLEGHAIVTTDQYGAGERVRLEGDGSDGVIARVSVGDAHVRVR